MDKEQREALARAGWKIASVEEFLDLTPEESRYIEIKLALARTVYNIRVRKGITQAELARSMKSSQSRVAKLERCDPSVSVDLLLRAMLALGASTGEISTAIGESK